MTTKTRRPVYVAGDAVEFSAPDFAIRGMPLVWWAATVETVTVTDVEKGIADVMMRVHADGRPHVERVGPRGGGKRIRHAQA